MTGPATSLALVLDDLKNTSRASCARPPVYLPGPDAVHRHNVAPLERTSTDLHRERRLLDGDVCSELCLDPPALTRECKWDACMLLTALLEVNRAMVK